MVATYMPKLINKMELLGAILELEGAEMKGEASHLLTKKHFTANLVNQLIMWLSLIILPIVPNFFIRTLHKSFPAHKKIRSVHGDSPHLAIMHYRNASTVKFVLSDLVWAEKNIWSLY